MELARDMASDAMDHFLNKQICEKLGVLPRVWTKDRIVIGAMNTDYIEVLRLHQAIQSGLGIPTDLEQITSDDWEKWFESNDTVLALEAYIPKTNNEEPSAITTDFDAGVDEAPSGYDSPYGKAYENKSNEIRTDSELLFDDIEAEYEADEDIGGTDGSEGLSSSDEIVRAVANILKKSDEIKASDIHIEPQEHELRVRYRVDGILSTLYSIPKKKSSGILARTKIIARLDVAEKRIPQDGRIRVRFGDDNLDFRVSTLPGKYGEKIVLRALRSDNSILNLEKLISEKKELKLLRELCDNPYGIFIVVGPTGSGKSTTLYSILSENNDPGINISTVEDPIEYTLEGLHQVQVIREKGLDFSRALRALMRQDPDVILVGETRDKETAQVAMEAALTGHMVYTTLHANDTATAISRLLEMGVAPYLIGASVVGVLSQRLMRRVCPDCSKRVASAPENELLRKFQIKEHVKATVKIGGTHQINQQVCSTCNGTGYKGRIGVYEVLRIDDDIRSLILAEKSADEIRERSRLRGMRTLLEYGMELVRQGLSTLEEVQRVCVLETDDETVSPDSNEA